MSKLLFVAGCDPELMLVKKDKLCSAIGVVPGSKHDPHKVECGAIQSDNVNLEFNTDPAFNISDFINNIKVVLKQAKKKIGDVDMIVRASANFPESELQDENARKFGCEPDFDGWEMCVNEVAGDAAESTFRSAGGHIHIGATKDSKFLLEDEGRVQMVKAMDATVGIASLLLDKDKTSAARRALYGKAGCHRPKSYGVEYRTLGNFWVNSPELVELILEMTNIAVDMCLKGVDEKLIKELGGQKQICSTINKSNVKSAREKWENVISKYFPPELVDKFTKIEKKNYSFYEEWGLR